MISVPDFLPETTSATKPIMPTAEAKPPTPDRIFQMMLSFAPSLMLEAALRHNLFTHLDAGPMTAGEIAAAANISERGARMLLDALVSLEFATKADGRYGLTPESAAFLVPGKPAFQGGMFKHISKHLLPGWLHLAESVRTGKPEKSVNQEGTGAEFFQEFVEDLFPRNYPAAQTLADHLGAAGATTPFSVLDIAAGSGVWSLPFAEKSPHARVTIVDWPGVTSVARRVTARHGVADRYDYREGDLAEVDFGAGYRAAVLGHILHSEGEARSRGLIRKVFAALAPGGTIAIAEMIPNEERTGPPAATIFALNMLIHTDEGDTFTFNEMSAWLQEAGFEEPYTLEVPGPFPLVLARKPK
jgi:2-polyprenyl-3-methyl-5-hydroxy-6-metoxy-1,4-benzoquinol methylase